jgi:hypothetical protein
MKIRTVLLLMILAVSLTACRVFERSETRASTSLVGFLYPTGALPPRENSIPQLRLPVRVGLAFLPSRAGMEPVGLEAARRDELLERIRERFADRKFVSEIVIVPDYYLKGAGGFESPQGVQPLYGVTGAGGFASLQGVQRLYDVDVIALVSYDQVTYRDDNSWSLGYLTIVGAYLVKGTRHDVTTLMDLAVVDPASRSILLRAGGADDRHGTTTLIGANRESRLSRGDSFDRATDELIQHFDTALTKFEMDVRKGTASVQVVQRAGRGGAGALDPRWLALLAMVFWGKWLPLSRRWQHRSTAMTPTPAHPMPAGPIGDSDWTSRQLRNPRARSRYSCRSARSHSRLP